MASFIEPVGFCHFGTFCQSSFTNSWNITLYNNLHVFWMKSIKWFLTFQGQVSLVHCRKTIYCSLIALYKEVREQILATGCISKFYNNKERVWLIFHALQLIVYEIFFSNDFNYYCCSIWWIRNSLWFWLEFAVNGMIFKGMTLNF